MFHIKIQRQMGKERECHALATLWAFIYAERETGCTEEPQDRVTNRKQSEREEGKWHKLSPLLKLPISLVPTHGHEKWQTMEEEAAMPLSSFP